MKLWPDPIAPGIKNGQLDLDGGVTKFGSSSGSGDNTPPCQDSNSAATTSNPRPRTGRISPSLETTVEAGESLTGEPLRNPLPAKQRLSPTRPPWVRACASFLPQRVETRLRADNMLPQQPRVKLMCSPGRYYPLGGHGHARNEGRDLFAPCRHCRPAVAMLGAHCFSQLQSATLARRIIR